MNTSRFSAVIVAMLATFAAGGCADEADPDSLVSSRGPARDNARTSVDESNEGPSVGSSNPGTPAPAGPAAANNAPGGGTGTVTAAQTLNNATGETGGETVRLDSVNKLWVSGDGIGPKKPVGKLTGAGIMDAKIEFDRTTPAKAKAGTEVVFLTSYTLSDETKNQNAANESYLRGGFAIGKLTEKGVELGQGVKLPKLNGDRSWLKPLVQFTPEFGVLTAASEDNNVNNGNPRPVLYLVDKSTGKLAKIANNTRGANSEKPTDLIAQCQKDGKNIPNANNQRSPQSVVPLSDREFIVSMQYNNQAQEAIKLTIAENGAVTCNWFARYTENTSVHSRAYALYTPGDTVAYQTAIECNNQPADIGLRLTKLDIKTGKALDSKIVVRSNPKENKYVAEPHILDLGENIGLGYALSSKAREKRDGNGHAGGANVSMLTMFSKANLQKVGQDLIAPSAHARHPGFFTLKYGADEKPAIAAISGSSTGQSKGLLQVIPYEGAKFGTKDPNKLYTVSTYSDVANLQARGKRNPNNQAKGFVWGVGDLPNPGFDKPGGFYPEVKSFSLSSVTGYSSPEAAGLGQRESLWLALVPSTWKVGVKTVPGGVSETAGTGPAPRTTTPPTNEAAEVPQTGTTVTEGEPTTTAEDGPANKTRAFDGQADSGCAVGPRGASGGSVFGIALGLAALLGLRRKRENA